MTVNIEADSLSDINQIASNPPSFPRNPAEKPRKPLTLYIARVPGSKDIFLTTLKPYTKNVTAQDVVSSLYYFHVNSDIDNQPSPKSSPKFPGDVSSHTLTRKPLPLRSSNNSSDNELHSTPDFPKAKTFSIRRKPVAGSIPTTSTQHSHADQPTPRQPLGPRNTSSVSVIERKPLPRDDYQNSGLAKTNSHPNNPNHQDNDFSDSNHKSVLESNKSEKAFSVTIIRRDPSSGAQWNIGIISGNPLIEETSDGHLNSRSAKRPYYDISLSLITSGYARFRDKCPIIDQTLQQSSNSDKNLHQECGTTFDRKIKMEGSSFWNRASAQRKRALSDFSDKYRNSCGLRIQENENQRHDTRAHAKGYVFTSPWGGRCKFVTGSGGRSLRCHHKLPSPISANSMDLEQHSIIISELRFNLPISFLSYSTAPQSIGRKVDFFSESQYKDVRNKMKNLKFTGPPLSHRNRSSSSFDLRSRDGRLLARTSSRTSIDSQENIHGNTINTSKNSLETMLQDNKEENVSNKYLDLGREKAGGGSNGKHAKLGKIIIHDEGIKMLDLIVSANMGIWWSVWDRY